MPSPRSRKPSNTFLQSSARNSRKKLQPCAVKYQKLKWPVSHQLPVSSGEDLVKQLARLGFATKGQTSGHDVMQKDWRVFSVTLNRELSKGPHPGILNRAGIETGDFRKEFRELISHIFLVSIIVAGIFLRLFLPYLLSPEPGDPLNEIVRHRLVQRELYGALACVVR